MIGSRRGKRLRIRFRIIEQYDVQYRTIAPDGRQRWVRANGRAFYDKTGRPVRFDGITQDITARKQAEDALRASESRFAIWHRTWIGRYRPERRNCGRGTSKCCTRRRD